MGYAECAVGLTALQAEGQVQLSKAAQTDVLLLSRLSPIGSLSSESGLSPNAAAGHDFV